MRVWRAAAVALALAASMPAAPSVAHHGDQDDFDTCRSVALLHLQASDWDAAAVSEKSTIALLEQIGVAMVEGVFGTPMDSTDDLTNRLIQAEAYFLRQSRRLAAAQSAFPTTRERDKVLSECFGFIWPSVKREIDQLMKWRERAIDAPEREYWPPGFEPRSD